MKNIIATFLVIIASGFAHPMHVSVCEIEFDAGSKSLEITQRVFIDDLELALRKATNNNKLNVLSPPNGMTTDRLISDYLKANLKIVMNGKKREVNYLGHEEEGDTFWCYLEVEKVKRIEEISVFSNIMCNVYDDQVNLVHIQYGDEIKSLKLTSGKNRGEVTFDR